MKQQISEAEGGKELMSVKGRSGYQGEEQVDYIHQTRLHS